LTVQKDTASQDADDNKYKRTKNNDKQKSRFARPEAASNLVLCLLMKHNSKEE
jgi:hypothetical protein